MKTLTLNTYAGSLLLGANAIKGANIIGSFEDVGFGALNPKANRAMFTEAMDDFVFIDYIRQWPHLDLTDTVVLAHPPCSAFSQQNMSAAKRGTGSEAFQCTVKVLRYAMTNGAAAIAVESVMGALVGAWDIYDSMAEAGGYYVYRVLKNSLLFGVPQFRERFWAVLIRKDLAGPTMTWRLSPHIRTMGSVLDPIHPGTPVDGLSKSIDKFIQQLTVGPCRCGVSHGFDEADLRATGLANISGARRKGFSLLIQPKFFPAVDSKVVRRLHVSPFTSGQPSVLAPGGFAPVLLGSSLWIYRGVPVSQEGYKAIMGFPIDYQFPKSPYGMRTYLSKGVCPPVATWILDNILNHLGAPHGRSPFTLGEGYVKTVEPDHVVSFRPSRVSILKRLDDMWEWRSPDDDELLELRDEEDDIEGDVAFFGG